MDPHASAEPTSDNAPPAYTDAKVQETSQDSTNKTTSALASEKPREIIPVSLTIRRAYVQKRYDEHAAGMMTWFSDVPKDCHCETFALPMSMTRAEFVKAMEPRFQEHFGVDMTTRSIDPKHGALDAIECHIDVRGKGLLSAGTLITVPEEASWRAAKSLMQDARGEIAITFMYACSNLKRSQCLTQ